MDTINLKKTEGDTVIISTVRVDTIYNPEEIKQQLRYHCEAAQVLEAQLKAIEDFQASSKTEDTPVLVKVANSIVDNSKLDVVSPKAEAVLESKA